MHVVAIIPARGGSKGIPRKNIQPVLGKPLLAFTIEQSRSCKLINRTIVNTEDAEIRAVAESFGAEVIGRPEEFYHDNTFQEVDRLLIWTVRELEKAGPRIDVVVLLYATSPLRSVQHIEETVRKVVAEGFDSALTLFEDSTYLWKVAPDGTATPTNYDPKLRGPRQKEAWNQWGENKAAYAMTRDLLLSTGCRLGGRVGYAVMSKLDSIDVDQPDDLALVRALMQQRLTM